MTITPERAKALYFGQPYYTTPAAAFVYKTNTTYKTPADLSGKKIGVCGGCTYESFLNGSLVVPGVTINFTIKNATAKTYDTDSTALADLELGDGVRLDAVITAQPPARPKSTTASHQAVGRSTLHRVSWTGVRPQFNAGSSLVDRGSLADHRGIAQGRHPLKLCMQWEGSDLAAAAATFDASQFGK